MTIKKPLARSNMAMFVIPALAAALLLIDKLSILVTVVFSYIVFHEKLTKKAGLGLVLIVAGTLLMLV